MKPHRLPAVYEWVPWLAEKFTVFQVEPLGYGRSAKTSHHPLVPLHEQVHAVLDQERVDRFVVWGYSAGGAMALTVAQASDRVTAAVCGGWSPAERQSDARLQRIDREQRAPVSQRAFWRWHSSSNWLDELAALDLPVLVYVGNDDRPRVRGPRSIPRTRAALIELGITVFEFADLDHLTCQSEPAFSTRVGPAVIGWFDDIQP
jgi:pimeloyl-ACP methyl ester carboxylesterase